MVSLAVLVDEVSAWRPDTYEQGRWGCELRFRYPIAKLADWRGRRDALLASENPFATVMLAHLAAQDIRDDMSRRERVKLALIRRLYERGYSKEQVLTEFVPVYQLAARTATRGRSADLAGDRGD